MSDNIVFSVDKPFELFISNEEGLDGWGVANIWFNGGFLASTCDPDAIENFANGLFAMVDVLRSTGE